MQGHHHYHQQQQQQQQLAALLSAALPSSSAAFSSESEPFAAPHPPASAAEAGRPTDSDRVAALNSLHRAIIYPLNSLLVFHSGAFLSQGLSQLLSDPCHAVRQAAAVTYGSFCAVVCSTRLASNGWQSTGLPERFISWALPLVRSNSAEHALEGLHEFLSVGDATSTQGYVPPILKACQELLEDERTSLNLLRKLLSLLSLISFKFGHCFQPHFVDVIDLLLGWALVPDLSELDRQVIMESFLQFKSHWMSNLQFSVELLSKFLGDMEVLIQDGGFDFTQKQGRLFALFSCFSIVLQATASGMAELDLLEQVSEPLDRMIPRLLGCLSMIGTKFGWEKWMGESWRCIIFIAGMLKEKFSNFYMVVIDILFQNLKVLPVCLLPQVLKANLQVLTLQQSGLLSTSVKRLLQFDQPFSLSRLHPNQLVVGSLVPTYFFLLQHDSTEVVSHASSSLVEELKLLKNILKENHEIVGHGNVQGCCKMTLVQESDLNLLGSCSIHEMSSLIKFDLKVLLSCISMCSFGNAQANLEIATVCHDRSRQLTASILENFYPFEFPFQNYLELQIQVVKTLHKLSEAELLSKSFLIKHSVNMPFGNVDEVQGNLSASTTHCAVIVEGLNKYSCYIVGCLSVSSPLSVKLAVLEWLRMFCEFTITYKDSNLVDHLFALHKHPSIGSDLLHAILVAASDRELQVRSYIASTLERLLQAGLVSFGDLYLVADVAVERLGDPDIVIKGAFLRVLAIVLPMMCYAFGVSEETGKSYNNRCSTLGKKQHMNWKHALSLRQLPKQLHYQHLVSILSYISQKWKAPLSSWIQRLIFSCSPINDVIPAQQDDLVTINSSATCFDNKPERIAAIEKVLPVNNLAAVWWAINEAARHAVTLRLRTNFGGPAQTFAALERMLLDISHVLLVDSEQPDTILNTGSSDLHLLPMRLLLDFVESLKKNVFNAYEGSSVLPYATRQSSLYFRANRRVCEEWFSRLSEPMLNAAIALQCHDAIIHYCTMRLHDLQNVIASTFKDKIRGASVSENICNFRVKLSSDLFRFLRHAALALCRSHEPEALIGLQNWVALDFSFLFLEENQIHQGNNTSLPYFSWITGLVYQAQGQYERAAAYFSHLLQSEEVLSSMGSEGIQFVIARIIESYTSISDWKSLEIWLSELQALRSKHAGKSYSGALTAAGNEINAVHALAHFEEGDAESAWSYLDLTPKCSNEITLDPRLALERSEHMLLRAMLKKDGKMEAFEEAKRAKLMIDEVLSVAPLEGLTVAVPYATQLYCIFSHEEGSKHNGQDEFGKLSPMLGSFNHVLHFPINKVHQEPSLWLKIFRVHQTVMPISPTTLVLCQKLVTLARKQHNFMLAKRLSQCLQDNLSSSQGDFSNTLSLNLQYEMLLLEYAEGKHEEALTGLWAMLRTNMLFPETINTESCKIMKAKACLKLSAWLKQATSSINLENLLNKMHNDFVESGTYNATAINRMVSPCRNHNSNLNQIAILEEIAGTAIKLSCRFSSSMGKAWLSYASWCYDQAKSSFESRDNVLQSCSLSPVLASELPPGRLNLTEAELTKVDSIIKNLFKNSKYENATDNVGEELVDFHSHEVTEAFMSSLVEEVVDLINTSAGANNMEISADDCPASAVSSQLQSIFVRVNANAQKDHILFSITQLFEIWWSLRRRRVSLFGCAAHGYLQYLSHCSSRPQEYHSANSLNGFVGEKNEICTLRAALYVLQILLSFGVELRETIELGLESVPLFPWQEITPQLFARLCSHPQQEVRAQLEGLLMMLAKISPWSIIYPTLVDMNNSDGNPSEELQRILDCLVKLYPQLVQDVQLVIGELGNITVLWEEQWLSTLQDLHSDVVRRISLLKEEARRISANDSLLNTERNKINATKYSAMMAPVVVALERRLALTSRKPGTRHEEWFQKDYGEQLKNAIATFKTPPISPSTLGEVWRPFDIIVASLANNQRKTAISLAEVAPRLALLSSSEVPMPGLERHMSSRDSNYSQSLVTISSFSEHVTILSTKTKPKKIVILGSDGQKYTYLLKGREDLRLDARIMQVLQAVNNFFSSSSVTRSHCLGIRFYSVTPISGRAGLIQWVDNVTSIYSVFKSWQSRKQFAQLLTTGIGSTSHTIPPVPRPSDMFYGKIIPALKEKGIKRVISRRDWPHEVKRKVLLELMKETPRELLRQEIWCASEGFKEHRSKSKRFCGSTAAMSMVGYILGLGDRHLDNILFDFDSGDVVHIDYNVCFDKGRRLKIPEIVPFRLTQIMEAALGLTGTEGTFKSNCEAALAVLRKNKDVLLMMLEVFVWDPLVEWTRGDVHDEAAIGGEEKKGMELAVSLSLFSSRFQEIRAPLQENQDLLISTLPDSEAALEKFLNVLQHYKVVSSVFYHTEKERSNLLQHETSARSFVAEATSISEKARASFEAHSHDFVEAKAAAAEKAQEATTWIEQHRMVLDSLRSGSLPEFRAFVRFNSMGEALSLKSSVLIAGIPLTVVPEPTQAQIYDLDKDIFHFLTELDTGLSCALETLKEYSLALQRVLPLNYITSSLVNNWAQILQMSLNNISSEFLSVARQQAADLITKTQGDSHESPQERHRNLLHSLEKYVLEKEKVKDEYSGLMNSIGSDTKTMCKERLLSAFSRYVQSPVSSRKGDDVPIVYSGEGKLDGKKETKKHGLLDDKKNDAMKIVYTTIIALFQAIESKVLEVFQDSSGIVGWSQGDDDLCPNSSLTIHKFEEQIDKCVFIFELLNELEDVGVEITNFFSATQDKSSWKENWYSVFQDSVRSCKTFVERMVDVILPEIIRSLISYHTDVMEAFGAVSQIRSTIDTAVEQLKEVEMEMTSLVELESNYFLNVRLITERKHSLEEASVRERDHLSWEEAEELASQEETCRVQLDRLHQSWNQKDMRRNSLAKREANIRLSLLSSEQCLLSLVNIEQGGDPDIRSSQVLLAMLFSPFSDLESVEQHLLPCGILDSELENSSLAGFTSPEYSKLEPVQNSMDLLKNHSSFIWKVGLIHSFLDLCLHDVSSLVDHHVGFDQLYSVMKKKVEVQLQEHVNRYLTEKIIPVFLAYLQKQRNNFAQLVEERKEIATEQPRKDAITTLRLQKMLEEYCNSYETTRAAKSAVCLLKRRETKLAEAVRKTVFEIVQMEWLYDQYLPYLDRKGVIFSNIITSDELSPLVLNLNRSRLLENLQAFMSLITRSVEYLQGCENTSVSVEAQLERAMGWACAGSISNTASNPMVKSSGVPSEFHDHLLRRRQLLWAAREQASNILCICTSVLEFEASRDGLFLIQGDITCSRTRSEGRMWQHAYMKVLMRLDVTYESFFCAEEKLKVAENSMESAARGLYSATNELHFTSMKAKSASDELRDALEAVRDCTYETSAALSAFSRVSALHSTLASECGSMLEAVLAITEDLHDVYSLGKDVSAVHNTLTVDISKVNTILLPLEASLSKDVAAMTDANGSQKELNRCPPLNGEALYQSYYTRVQEACESLKILVPSIARSVKDLHTMLTKLARTASLHAGNLHKAFEGLGETQLLRSQDLPSPGSGTVNDSIIYENVTPESEKISGEVLVSGEELSVEDDGWISPPGSKYSRSPESSITSTDADIFENLDEEEGSNINGARQSLESFSSDCLLTNKSSGVPLNESEFKSTEIEGNRSSPDAMLPTDFIENVQASSLSPDNRHASTDSRHASTALKHADSRVLCHMDKKSSKDVKLSWVKNEKLAHQEIARDSTRDCPVACDIRGKNAYAMSVIRQLELKIDGRDVEPHRSMSISEQVDHLIKQATSIDNLCNMYEGWTPWI